MQAQTGVASLRENVYSWPREQSVAVKIVLAIAFVALTALLAQFRFYLPWSPIPITGQTFAVLLAGITLGRWWGGASMALYAVLGFAGMPLFAGLSGGITATGGYIVGFIPAALFIGHFTDKYVKTRNFSAMAGMMLTANFAFIYLPGLIWLGGWFYFVNGDSVPIMALLAMGALPFLAGDIIKAVLAAVSSRATLPQEK
jgi:biotin transport system substrate-specific component